MRRFLLAALLAALGLVAGACGGSSADAARVDGTTISRGDLLSEADAFSRLPDDPFQLRPRVEGDRILGYDAAGLATLLTQKVTDVLVVDAAERYGLEVTEEDRRAVRAGGLGHYAQLPADLLAALIDRVVLQDKVFTHVTTTRWWDDADIARYYELVADTRFSEACTSHILVETEEEAAAVLRALEDGAEFGDLAAERSLDTSNRDDGGDLGCHQRGLFVPPYEEAVAAARDGELIGPVRTEFGHHVIWVHTTYRIRPLDDQVVAELEAVFGSGRADGWADYQLRRAEVWVDPRYGAWNDGQFRVVPPDRPPSGQADPARAGP